MANFATHVGIGFVVCGAMTTLVLAADLVSQESLFAITLSGVVGSVLPDIDLKESHSCRTLFCSLALIISSYTLYSSIDRYSVVELWFLWFVTYILVRYLGPFLFNQFSYHRGIWHSLLAALFFCFSTTIVFKHVINYDEIVAWLAGSFVLVGYLTHLTLDELYSVDLMDKRFKASFGSALKLYDYRNISDTSFVAALPLIAFLLTPSCKPFINDITSPQLRLVFKHRFLPKGEWFGVRLNYLNFK